MKNEEQILKEIKEWAAAKKPPKPPVPKKENEPLSEIEQWARQRKLNNTKK